MKMIKGSYMKFFYVTNIFDLDIFDNETASLLKFLEICTEMHFVSLFFLKERNIATSLLMICLKCTAVHYANLNSSFINKPFLNYELQNMLFPFFRFLIDIYFNEAFVKNLMRKLSFLNTNFHNSFQDVVYYRILECQTLSQ